MKELKKLKMFKHRVFLTIGEKEYHKTFEKVSDQNNDGILENAEAMTWNSDDGGISIIYIDDKILQETCDHRAAIAAHEAYHVVKNIENYIGEDCISEEITSYIIQYIVKNIMKELIKKEGSSVRLN